jgi:hypothetical protein
VALAEYARHLREHVGMADSATLRERDVYRILTHLDSLLDLRTSEPELRSAYKAA